MELNAVAVKNKAFVYKLKHGRMPDGVTEQNLDEEINQREAAIINYEKDISEGKKGEFTGVAFVSFKIEPMKQEIIKKFSVSGFQRFRMTFECLRPKKHQSGLFMNGNRLYVNQASEPTDVYWQNLHLCDKEKYFRKLLGYIFSGFLLFLCALLIYYLLIKQDDLKKESKNKTGGDEALQIKALTTLLAIVIVVINKILGFVIPLIASY